MLERLKISLLKNSHRLPAGLNFALSKFNNDPVRVFGKAYGRYRTELQGQEGREAERTERLLSIVNYAVRQIPYYRERYDGKTIRSTAELQGTFGFTDKHILLEDPAAFRPEHFNEQAYELVTTAGTSGKPLQLYVPRNRYAREWATVHDAWSRAGFRFDHRAVMRNHRLPAGKTFVVNPFTKEIIFDNFRLTDEYIPEIYRMIRKYQVRFVHAYPSAVHHFVTYCHRHGLDLSFIRAFLCSSENVYPHQLEQVRQQSGARMFSFYGHTEKLVFGAFCEHTDHFHMDPDYGFFELVDEQGRTVNTPGMTGEITGTTLNNIGMPLIRYRTGDYAEYLGDHCPHCGRSMPVLKRIMGRWNGDRVYNRDGSYVTTTALNLHGEIYRRIDGLQYYQPEKGVLEVRIIKNALFTDADEEQLRNLISTKLSPSSTVTVRHVEWLERKQNGKFLLLISNVEL
ncbi:phenylacetate--CoA ligase family protein [Chitinophaga cymbidii]|uniref:Capsular polysaccharide biosynthesis protein CapK n=1 Tax=Chitinophaga cymbidii TaxID=1096750 RepID=A0A512RMH5_9BACT|nr:AMP-binding protein [Chitinophaga cymbidii]GEP96915.1 capsular polysaccharide biosynthesis protein CapK [Chitinophaga cymbidii]